MIVSFEHCVCSFVGEKFTSRQECGPVARIWLQDKTVAKRIVAFHISGFNYFSKAKIQDSRLS
jgi:hypothetical protein